VKRYIPLIIVSLLFLVGIIAGLYYIIRADADCVVERSQSDLGQVYRDNGERHANRYANSPRSQNERGSPPRPAAFAIIKAEAEQQKGTAQTSGGPAEHPRWLTKAFCDAKLADIALAYFAYGLIIVTGYLAWATIRLWSATIENERPWVGTFTVQPDKERNPFGAEIIIWNTGRRPALKMRIAHRGEILEPGSVPAIPDPRNEISKALFPNAKDFHYPLHGRAFTEAERRGFEAGTHVLWVIARIEYLDGWNNIHHTNICTRWDRERGNVRSRSGQ
jgi:hypothetical protein